MTIETSKAKTTLTKLQMAQVIIQALYNLPTLPEKGTAPAHIWKKVLQREKFPKNELTHIHEVAVKALLKTLK